MPPQPDRWNALVRHGLISTSLLGAAAVPAVAAPCDDIAPGTVGFVFGFSLGDKIKPMGGIEGRKCLDHRTEAMVRLELGGGAPVRVIGGLRVRPSEDDRYPEEDMENFGIEAGVAVDATHRFGAHVAGTFGSHSAYAALQGFLPAGEGTARASLLVGLAPWTAFESTVVDGRPLTRDGVLVRPGFAAPLAHIASAEARAVRDHFAGSAQIEYSSVWTFLRLASELMAAGAPAELVAAALDAADDEVRHAELCAGAAGGIALVPLAPAMAQARFTRRSTHALALLAAEAWREGCLNETAAAEEARLASGEAEGPARALLAAIAGDETRHAELSWSVLAWIFSIAPAVASQAVAAAPSLGAVREEPATDRALARHGVPAPAVTASARAHAARLARVRLAAMA
jgi:hypothetical protein